ncbi:MAG: PHP domain-containing protein, partial [Clostridia bacterium]|nr:PHP domain-containing protein [Clostridia bacterium]
MKTYAVDHDLHIHSQLSSCSSDPELTPERILAYAEQFGLKTVCVTDHFWDP